jgi:hypothetical protein
MIDRVENDGGAGGALTELALIDRGHHGDDRIPAEGGVIGQQDHGLTVRRHLHGAGHHGLRVEFCPRVWGAIHRRQARIAPEAESHPIALRLDGEAHGGQRRKRSGGKVLEMGSGHDAQGNRLSVCDSRRHVLAQMIAQRRLHGGGP